jgi:hypothetical protein
MRMQRHAKSKGRCRALTVTVGSCCDEKCLLTLQHCLIGDAFASNSYACQCHVNSAISVYHFGI